MERRLALKNLGGLLLLPSLGIDATEPPKKPVLRIAHITDVHLKNDFGAPDKFIKCLHHLQAQLPKVDLILNGGDVVFDMNKENIHTINDQWSLVKDIMKNESNIPIHYCLGNHDVWWGEDSQNDVFYGKKYSMDQLGLAKPYYSFVQKGWKFLILDSVHLDIDKSWYIGKLGDAQFEWLEQELKATPKDMPILVLSHIPILTALLMIEDNIVNKWTMLGGDMHTDTARIINLFYRYPNVKLCLSGHLHMRDKVIYNKVTYLCNGAVSGAWWKGQRRETPPGYGIVDLYSDGSFEESYLTY
ncbi:3',5'-cyclic AMP phosphodiesterase CpdA [Pedobacter psychrotolerans]|uniref:3',5'-cyclic AMP phosphodiesterase CpdA n=1 Tax=Pedobacter psychrotolerans TaxID=1843235 RepID=A0A4R2HE79_9SPHI|nr:metallophosphoesterase [Pedobacter psychrotolerans]TCO25243.1 3',5'-cyclic AMP phosphodiesterase CpdA [Pedobacter psychrotolerans]GGE46974.1 metallophosphoesterase [Pedobacter psychrotolerans]